MTRTGVFPGCFDRLRPQHLAAIGRARGLVDRLVVGVAETRYGVPVTPSTGRVEALRAALDERGLADVDVEAFDDLVVSFAHRRGADVLIRRADTRDDFIRVRQETALNAQMHPEIETVVLGPE